MAQFHCERFPVGSWPIRTDAGIVDFHDGTAEVDSPKIADALNRVPAIFGITGPPPAQTTMPPCPPPPAHDPGAVRKWARDNGHVCPKKGRIPQALMDMFNRANH